MQEILEFIHEYLFTKAGRLFFGTRFDDDPKSVPLWKRLLLVIAILLVTLPLVSFVVLGLVKGYQYLMT